MVDEEFESYSRLFVRLSPSFFLSLTVAMRRGDDHDSCIIEHPFSSPTSLLTTIREVTVKAFSMAMGVRKPGYHLLSLYPQSPTLPPSAPAKYTQTNCVLPDQIGIWLNVYLPTFIGLLLALLVRKGIYWSRGQMRRESSTARSNGLSVHSHSRSLSRKVIGVFVGNGSQNGAGGRRGLDDEGEAEDQFSRFPTFDGMNSSYHSGIDDEGPLLASQMGRDGGGGTEKRPQRVRRVSRVWAWEKGGFFSSLGAGFEDDGPTSSNGRGLTYGDSTRSTDDGLLAYLGPIHRYAIRPLVRTTRIMSRRMARSPVGGVVGGVIGIVLNDSVRELLGDLWRVCWIGFIWWIGISLSFMF